MWKGRSLLPQSQDLTVGDQALILTVGDDPVEFVVVMV